MSVGRKLVCVLVFLPLASLMAALAVQKTIYLDSFNSSYIFKGLDQATRQVLKDPRIGPPVVHPVAELYHNGVKVYWSNNTFLFDSRTPPPNGTCRKDLTPEIDPYAVGGPTNRSGRRVEKNCATLHFAKPSDRLPLVALASAPGSGNTWLRHLIQQLTGLYTGAIYNDITLYKKGFRGENRRDRSVVAVKTHENWNCSRQKLPCPHYEKAILIVRDPHQTILAEFNRHNSHSHTGFVNEALYSSGRWHKTSMILAKKWYQTIEIWSRFRNYKDLDQCVLFASFERLQTSMQEELTRIGQFLGVRSDFLRGKHMDCVIRNSKGNFKRSDSFKPSFGIFNAAVNNTIAMYKERVNSILTYFGAGFTV